MTLSENKVLSATCPKCDGIGSVCLACNQPIDDCDCFEDAEPCTCERCNGRGKVDGVVDVGDDLHKILGEALTGKSVLEGDE